MKVIFFLLLAVFACPLWAQSAANVPKAAQKTNAAEGLMQIKGFQIVQSREGQCTLCHQIPNHKGVMGNLGPALDGVAHRLNEEQLRLRLSDSRKINPLTIMPPYFSTENLAHVDPKFASKTLLNASEFEEVIAYLKTLQ
jgi:sulfur-oxidizing protein SoxX